ncbi:MAG TPA: hypothetical protein VG028_02530 [Terriglobia bacterium]|nr:hypothetical protein [Terriglobia bacterium]
MNFFERTLINLFEGGVNFVVIGGVAISAHGSAHVTFDLDICYDRSPENILRLVDGLKPCHPRLRGAPAELPFLFDSETIRRGLNFTLTTDPADINLLSEVAGIGHYKEALARSTTLELFGRPCHVLSLEGLIAAKRAAGRPRDLAVLPELEALHELETLQFEKADESGQPGKDSHNDREKPKGIRPH